MNGFKAVIIVSGLCIALISCVRYPPIEYDGTMHRGEATFYEDGRLGNCSFPPETRPLYHAAMNRVDYAGSRSCGTYITVQRRDDARKREVTVLIDNQCPECAKGDVDLSPAAFDKIADRTEGRVPVVWHYVPAPETRGLRFQWKEGSSRWWFQVMVLDHRYAVRSVEARVMGTNDWTALVRRRHNYWEAKNGIKKSAGPFDIRMTDVLGHVVTQQGVPLAPGRIVNGEEKRVK